MSGFDVRAWWSSTWATQPRLRGPQLPGSALSVRRGCHGTLAVVNLVSLEDLLHGLVPSEIFSARPRRGAQGAGGDGAGRGAGEGRHPAPRRPLPALLRAALRGVPGPHGRDAATNAAVEATRGEALFSTEGRLVDSVYSAVCGGHTEDNEVVWGGVPDPSLRGRPDVLAPVAGMPDAASAPERFLAFDLPAACRRRRFAQPTKYRWEKRFTAQQLDALVEPLEGRLGARTSSRSSGASSGRVRAAAGVRDAAGRTELRGELTIRRQFGMLNSALFVCHRGTGRTAAIRWRSSSGGAAGATASACARQGPSAGRRPDRTTGRSSGIISMAPRSCASTSRNAAWGPLRRTYAWRIGWNSPCLSGVMSGPWRSLAQEPPASVRSGPRLPVM